MKKQSILHLGIIMLILIGSSCKPETPEVLKEKDNGIQTPELSLQYDEKIDSLIALMTIEEKIGMLHGNSMFANKAVERLGIPELTMADGPLGVREEISRDSWAPAGWDNDFATYYPAGGGLAATWNTELSLRFGQSVGEESRARGKDVLLSPAINIIRTPLGGRTYEYFTEDPFLNARMSVPFIVGVQQNDVAVCVKHYAVNNQETNRDSVDVLVDERTLREIYLPAFKAAAVEANAYSFMGAYNKFRGEYLCENPYMLQDILRDEWGYKGIVISDWAAVHDTKKSLEAGTDIEMGTPKPFNEFYFADPLAEAVAKGEIEEAELDKHVKRILRVMFNLKTVDGVGQKKGSINTEEHFQDAYAIAAESVVLLKNESDLLPLKLDGVKRIAVIGNNATKKNALGGYGAGVKTKREITPLEGLKGRLPEGVEVQYAEGYRERYAENEKAVFGDITLNGPVPINELEPELVEQALDAVRNSDLTIVFAGSNRDYETEASDRASLDLPYGQEELIEKVLEIDPNAIVVFIAGGPFDIQDISEKSNALVWSWFNGSEGGNALADVLLGTVNPSGKLPWTMPKKLEDSPAHATNSFPGDDSVTYEEGILVGYRWFDTKNVDPLYEFGYGLSYADFQYGNMITDKSEYNEEDTVVVNVEVSNRSEVDGKEAVQLYVSAENSQVERAQKELKAFNKVAVPAGKTVTVPLSFKVKDLAYYDTAQKTWVVEKGEYTIRVGASSRDIKGEATIVIR
ncbi:beta-glucosidase family protein [Robertkochia sediminum]|uniref:beta-glucosidase family protein n=1 Tax=Robertkochia sediminum TaxID=2785326 RepID=UPI0019327670|nr:glycoside hydrolase family 3 C-terminal domain-containing protein [Robertkochia sediminum]MBL7474106.1 glycoside hydrolase family 3 C-terminal domain-containing protein [Robertkochia sediminum]